MMVASSFGRRPEPPIDDSGPVILPAVIMPPVQVPIILIVDQDSLAAAGAQIQEIVAGAVRAGFAAALADQDPGPQFDEPPTAGPRRAGASKATPQLDDLMR